MSSGSDGTGSGWYYPDSTPVKFADVSAVGTTLLRLAVAAPPANTAYLVQGVDVAATYSSSGAQCFLDMYSDPLYPFWHDSQSIGEGLGVRWNWRGSLLVRTADRFLALGTSSSNVNWAGIVWGWVVPYYQS